MSSHDVRSETEITDSSVCANQCLSSDSPVAAGQSSEAASEAELASQLEADFHVIRD